MNTSTAAPTDTDALADTLRFSGTAADSTQRPRIFDAGSVDLCDTIAHAPTQRGSALLTETLVSAGAGWNGEPPQAD